MDEWYTHAHTHAVRVCVYLYLYLSIYLPRSDVHERGETPFTHGWPFSSWRRHTRAWLRVRDGGGVETRRVDDTGVGLGELRVVRRLRRLLHLGGDKRGGCAYETGRGEKRRRRRMRIRRLWRWG